MFIGEYIHTIDNKGRITMPVKFRENLSDIFIITKGLDGCLTIYDMPEWEKMQEKIAELPNAKSRNLKRFLFSGAVEVSLDKQGRIVIPPNLRQYANITKDVASIGASGSIEVWDLEKWNGVCDELTPDMIAEAMDELGF